MLAEYLEHNVHSSHKCGLWMKTYIEQYKNAFNTVQQLFSSNILLHEINSKRCTGILDYFSNKLLSVWISCLSSEGLGVSIIIGRLLKKGSVMIRRNVDIPIFPRPMFSWRSRWQPSPPGCANNATTIHHSVHSVSEMKCYYLLSTLYLWCTNSIKCLYP